MRIRIGAIGPRDSLDKIKEVAIEDSRIELVEFEYFHSDELEHLIQNNRYDVTQWIFSGQTPYYYALHNGWITEEEGYYPQLHGMGLLGTILKIFLERGEVTTALSLDSVNEHTVQLVSREYNLNSLHFELLPYNQFRTYEEIIDFHMQSYIKKKTEVAVTCLLTVYDELKKRGIPCYRIVPSHLAIQNVFNLLVSRAKSQIYQKSKVAIMGFELADPTALDSRNVYESRKNKLIAELELVSVAEKLNGVLSEAKDDRFHIYTTYGDVELFNSSQSLNDLVKEFELKTSLNLKVGIGSGYTIDSAMEHVGLAFESLDSLSNHSIPFVNQEKKVIDLSKENTTYFTVENLPDSWKKVMKENNYTPTIPAKIYHFIKLKRIEHFDSDLITSLLKNTDRNSRRILNELEQMGLLQVCKEESTGKPGRPKKVYTLML
ncbi:hypothetical protein F7731_10315 [Cytobacillus depressus]|uniref:Transcriptional regulator n=1 Tax=Cytobacillus depressus TaxID=1602942 RepID=A0A6L3V6H1_9BACI|nr:hypothetical protein [Cytobacillus depressus]KAB2336738.1 hypothetical protein F7731_10315 [Cytobacillus depressus]